MKADNIGNMKFDDAVFVIEKTETKKQLSIYLMQTQELLTELKTQLECYRILKENNKETKGIKWYLGLKTKHKYLKRLFSRIQSKVISLNEGEAEIRSNSFDVQFVEVARELLPESVFDSIKEKVWEKRKETIL